MDRYFEGGVEQAGRQAEEGKLTVASLILALRAPKLAKYDGYPPNFDPRRGQAGRQI